MKARKFSQNFKVSELAITLKMICSFNLIDKALESRESPFQSHNPPLLETDEVIVQTTVIRKSILSSIT